MSTKSTPQSKNNEALCAAAAAGDTAAVQRLLTAGADVHALDDAPLRFAARNGHTDTCAALLTAGADVHAHDDTPLYLAAINGHLDTCKFLLTAGANPVCAFPAGTRFKPVAADTLDAAIMAACPDRATAFRAAHRRTKLLPQITAHLEALQRRASLERPG